jgi:hypothetical protein
MSELEIGPRLLERIVAWGELRLESKRWKRDGSERLFALQYLRWGIALEVNGAPGQPVAWFLRRYGHLAKLVIRELQENGAIEVCAGEALAGWNRDYPDESLWQWLGEHIPDGFPAGW